MPSLNRLPLLYIYWAPPQINTHARDNILQTVIYFTYLMVHQAVHVVVSTVRGLWWKKKEKKKNLTGDSSQMKAICLCGAIG